MKYLIFLGVLIGLYVFGNVMGPHITPLLVEEDKSGAKLKRDVILAGNDVKMTINLAEMRDSELPTEVKIVKPVQLPLVSGDGTKMLVKGDVVKLLNRREVMLIIESLDGLSKGEVGIDATDIFKTVAKAKFAKISGGGSEPTKPEPKPEKKEPVPDKEEPKMADNKTTVPEVPEVKPAPEKVEEKPMKKPEPEPEPAASVKLTDEQMIEQMKASIKGGAVKEFSVDQVKSWKVGADEEIDGVKYRVGLAVYEAKTIFGVREVTAKALFAEGKLKKWVYANTGMQIR